MVCVVCAVKKPVCPLKHVPICTFKNVPVYAGTTRTDVFNVHMGTCLSGHTGGRVFSSVKTSVFDICFASQPANYRVTKICPRISLDPRGSPKETILNAPLLPVAMYSSYEARKNTLQTICSATFAPFTPHHTPLHHQRHHTTKKQRHTRTRTCKCTCICNCMCTCRCTCMCICIYIYR